MFTQAEKTLLIELVSSHIKIIEASIKEECIDRQKAIKEFYQYKDYKTILSKLENNNA